MGTLSKIAFGGIIYLAASLGPQAAFADNFGAVAYSPSTGAWGRSWDYPTRRQAEREALKHCRKRARDCKVNWFRNACGAIAVGRNGGWGSSWGHNRRQAENKARASCRRYDSGCKIRVWQCTTR